MKKTRKIMFWAVLGGVCYGLVSAGFGRNPHYETVEGDRNYDTIGSMSSVLSAETVEAWRWRPSVVWAPAYLLCEVARHTGGNWAGIRYTKSGYLFRNWIDLFAYFVFAGIIGGVMGLGIGFGIKGLKRRSMGKEFAYPMW